MRNAPVEEYVDQAVFDADARAVFERTWQLLGPASQVADPCSYVVADICGRSILVRRGRDGVVRGVRNVCRHRGARLLPDGVGHCAALRCEYHQWLYADSGELLRAPWFGDPGDIDLADWPLVPVAVEEWRGLLFASIDPVEPLVDQLGDLVGLLADEPIERYVHGADELLEFDASWKIYTDNFVEGYHIPGIHPAFRRAIDFERFETTVRRGLIHMTAPPTGELIYRGTWLWMWPNWTLSLFDGGMNTSRINPLAADRTELRYHFSFADTSPEAKPAQRALIEANLAIVREDFGICVDTQRNYASRAYTPGPLSPRHERGVAYFQDRLRRSRAGDATTGAGTATGPG